MASPGNVGTAAGVSLPKETRTGLCHSERNTKLLPLGFLAGVPE